MVSDSERERTDDTRAVHRTGVTLGTGNVLLTHEAAAFYQPG